jgi:iron complex transport system substrate-binding protein
MSHLPRWRRALGALGATVLAIAATACGSDSDDGTSAATTAASSTAASTAAGAGATTRPADAPHKIVSISPTATEMLFAIGAGSQVIAVDDQSSYPPEAAEVRSDLSGFTPNVEAIAKLKPDLVVYQPNDGDQLEGQLEALGIKVWGGPTANSFDDIYTQIEQLGAATGHVGDAAELVAHMKSDITEAVASAPRMTGKTYFHEVDNTLYSVGTKSFIGEVYGLFGLKNIVDGDDPKAGYPQLSNEAVIAADPDFIFLSDADYGESPQTAAARPGWGAITAVKDGNVIPISADLSSRWGPRIVDYVEAVSAALARSPQPAKS